LRNGWVSEPAIRRVIHKGFLGTKWHVSKETARKRLVSILLREPIIPFPQMKIVIYCLCIDRPFMNHLVRSNLLLVSQPENFHSHTV
jgi:hypothetical protein